MGYTALFSGGKDSTLALWKAKKQGLSVDRLLTMRPEKDDSYMFHKANLEYISDLALSLNVDLVEVETSGEKEKELGALEESLRMMDTDGLITGAVASDYQMSRIEGIAEEQGLDIFAPLWGMDQREIIEEIVNNDFKVVIVRAAAMGLDEDWLGRTIDRECMDDLLELNERYRINIAGEGGEYETFVLDSPDYRWSFKIERGEKRWDGQRGLYHIEELSPVG